MQNIIINVKGGTALGTCVDSYAVKTVTPPELVIGCEYMLRLPQLACCINGHGHSMRHDDLMGDGVIYHQTGSLNDRIYMLFTFNNDGTYSYEEVAF